MTITNIITASDIDASIGRTVIAARTLSGEWFLCTRESGFMSPLVASVVRSLTDIEAAEAEAALTSVDGPSLSWLAA